MKGQVIVDDPRSREWQVIADGCAGWQDCEMHAAARITIPFVAVVVACSGDDFSSSVGEGGAGNGGTTGGSVGNTGGSAGSTGGSAGSTGGSAGSTGGSAGSTGGSAGSTGGSAGSTGGSSGTSAGAAGAEGGALGWCESHAVAPGFCMDFDAADGLGVAYENGQPVVLQPRLVGSGAEALLGRNFVSAPASFEAKTPEISTGSVKATFASLVGISQSVVGARLRFALRLNSYSPASSTSNAYIARVFLRDDTQTVAKLVSGSLFLMGQTATARANLGSPDLGYTGANVSMPPLGTFVEFEINVWVDAQASHLELRKDDAPAATVNTGPALAAASQIDFEIGVDTTGPFNPVDVEIDNVTFDPIL